MDKEKETEGAKIYIKKNNQLVCGTNSRRIISWFVELIHKYKPGCC